MQADDVALLMEAVAELVREEVRQVATSGRNWKIIVNGSATGDVRVVIEQHADVIRRCQSVALNS